MLGSTGIAISIGTLLIFAVISGFFIIGLTLYSAAIDRIRDYGTLKAQVVSIAPEASLPPASGDRGGSAAAPPPVQAGGYEVTLRPDGTVLRSRTRRCDLRLGMDLTADITTRVETVLGFLLRKARLTTGV